jgi:acetyltransferase-like isoleucine patch superfamily enzyme
MPSAEEREHVAGERRRLAEWLAGDRSAPFVVDRQRSCCTDVDAIFWPTRRARLGRLWRYLMVSLGGLLPACPLKVFCYRRAGVRIAEEVCISPGVVMDPLFPELVELQAGSCLGMGARVLTHEYTAASFRVGPVRVGPGAVVGAFSTLRSGVTVGERATIGCNSYVNRDVAPGDVVGGVPARSLKPGAAAGEGHPRCEHAAAGGLRSEAR